MKKAFLIAAFLCLGAASIACAQDEGAPAEETAAADAGKPETLAERAGYAIGLNMGTQMHQQEVAIDLEALIQGLRDGLAGEEGAMTQEEMQATMNEFQQQMMAQQQEMAAKAMEENHAEGEAFREQFKAQEGVQSTESGILYQVIEEGTGAKPTPSDRVSVHYRGSLPDDTQFDSSYDRGQPATFPVTGVVQGWQEVLQLMPVGSKWKVVIPPELAYGERGSPPRIGPGETLVFEIELLGIESQGDAGAAEAPAAGGDDGGGR